MTGRMASGKSEMGTASETVTTSETGTASETGMVIGATKGTR